MALLIALPTFWLLADHLGPDAFGTLSLLLAIIALVGPISSLGLNAVVVRELIKFQQREEQILTTVLVCRIAGSVIAATICILVAFSWGELDSIERTSIIILSLASIFHCFYCLEFWFQSKVNAASVAKMRLLVQAIFAIIKVAVVLSDGDLIQLVVAIATEQVFLGIGFALLFLSKAGLPRFDVNLSYALGLLRQSVWLLFSGIAAILYLKIDQLMLAEYATRDELGVYSVAVKFSEIWYFFATAIVVTIFPSLLTARRSNRLLYDKRLQQICDFLFIAALTVAFIVSFISPFVISFLFDDAYTLSATILSIHIWASIFVFMRALVSKWLIAENLLKFSLYSHGIGAIINIIGNIVMIPAFGAVGAAYATLLSYAFSAYVVFWLHPSTWSIAGIMSRTMLLPFTLGRRYWSYIPSKKLE